MNILFTRFPLESAYGGAEVQTLSLIKGLKEKGHDVTFVGSCSTLLQECRKQNIECRAVDIGAPPVTKWGAVNFLWRQHGMRNKLIKFLEDRKSLPQAIFMLSLTEKILLTPWVLKMGIRVFWIEHDRIGHWLTWNPWLPRLRRLSKQVTTIVVSELSRKIYLDLGWIPEKTIAIPNGMNIKQVSTPSPYPHPSGKGNNTHIGCIARLTADKGVDLLIEAIVDMPNISLTIVGRGQDEGYLHKLINEYNVRDRIRIIPWIDELGSFYQSIDALILPSREHDPFGLVAAEAMLYGVPVIVTEMCGIVGYLHSGINAIVAKANSTLDLKEAINRILSLEYRISIAKEGQKTAQEKFSLEKMIDAYERVLHSPLHPKGPLWGYPSAAPRV